MSFGGASFGVLPFGDPEVVSGGGPNIYTIVPTGSIVFSGVAVSNRVRLQPTSGTIVFGGTAPFSQNNTYTFAISGGITLSGASPFSRTHVQLPSGAIGFTGTTTILKVRGFIPTGTIVFSGTTTNIYTRSLVPSGQIIFSGTAPLINPNAPTGVSTWRTLTGSGN